MNKIINERYEVSLAPTIYYVRWLFIWSMVVLLIIYGLKSEGLDKNFELLFLVIGLAFFILGTMVSSGCYMLKGIWFNIFIDMGLIKKYKNYNFNAGAEALAMLPMVSALMYFGLILISVGKLLYSWLLIFSVWMFALPYVIYLLVLIKNSVFNMEKKPKKHNKSKGEKK